MHNANVVFYVSGSTGILAKSMGKALLAQFPDLQFQEESFPFIKTEDDARNVLKKILSHSSAGARPIVLSTLLIKELNDIFDIPEVSFLNIIDHFLVRLEDLFQTKALRVPGYSRQYDDTLMTKRVDAIHYSITHDDGIGTIDYEKADLILVGVSRSGKTPVSVYLATQMGLKTANYPLVDEDLEKFILPLDVVKNLKRVVGLSTSPKMLHIFRENRYKGSKYANIATCIKELNQAKELFKKYNIPIVLSDGGSIEETATQIIQILKSASTTNF